MEMLKARWKFEFMRYFEKIDACASLNNAVHLYGEKLRDGHIDAYEIFHYAINTDIRELCEISGFVVYYLLKEPELIQETLNEFMLILLESFLGEKGILQLNQISCPIIIGPVPNMETESGGLEFISGIVVQYTIPQKYVTFTRWKCNEYTCTTLKPCVSRRHKSLTCAHCGKHMEEIPSFRKHGVTTTLKIVNRFVLTPEKKGVEWFRSVKINDEREFKIAINLGSEMRFAGIYNSNKNVFDVWGLQEETYILQQKNTYKRVDELRESLKHSPWEFVRILASCIGGKLEAFLHLKIALLLSLASRFEPVPVLAICENTRNAEILMQAASKLTERLVNVHLPTILGGQVKDNCKTAGSLLLATNGVCYLGNWSYYNAGKSGRIIVDALDTGRVVLEGGKSESQTLKSAVWTYWDTMETKSKKGKVELDTLLKVFGFALNDSCDVEESKKNENIILSKGKSVQCLISEGELKDYLADISWRSVEMTEGAMDLLQNYFVCARKARGEDLPFKSLDHLRTLTEAHARLNRRDLAYPEDALAAVELCEHSLGTCDIFTPPPLEMWAFSDWFKSNVLNLNLNSQSEFSQISR